MTEAGWYLGVFAVAMVVALLMTGSSCASLPAHERMGALSRAAVHAHKQGSVPAAAALVCAKAARDAGLAIQAARSAQAVGAEDPELTARALALPRAAEEACRRAGIQAEAR